MERCRKAGPRTKLSLVSSAREWKWSRGHREASWKTRSSLRHVWAKLFRLFLSRKEKRCRRHSQFSSVKRIALRAWAAKAAGSPRRARGLISFQRLQIPCTNMVWNGSYFWLPAGREVSKKDKAPVSLREQHGVASASLGLKGPLGHIYGELVGFSSGQWDSLRT